MEIFWQDTTKPKEVNRIVQASPLSKSSDGNTTISHLSYFRLAQWDLWAGNHITGNDGKGWLIDPAVYYGHPEADLAMTELFGGFPNSFYEAYKEYGNLDPGYKDRRDIYNLYQLLNHLNMFGGGYYSSVRSILKRYS